MATSRLHSRRSAVQVQDIPLNILDFKIPTEIQGDFIRHTYFNTDCSPDKQSVQREEVWKRERILGQGSHGIIYLERCRKNGNKLRAVKGIKKYTRAGENESAHKRELEAVVGFSRPQYSHCFVRSDGWFEDEHSVFIILEYLELGDLQQYLNHPFSEYETREITKQVLEGLTYMHENAFIHRDLKPQNILVVAYSPDWHVKIADFGISKQQSDEDVRHTLEQGTIGFAAPEQLGICKGAFTYTCAVDMWSLGAVAYRMFTGTNAFEGLTELVEYVAGRLPFPIGNLKSQQMSATGLDFILKLMSPVMESRPAAMDAYRHRWFTRTNLPRGLDSR
ncbi:kinase-like domain-containing protein [Podospora fimiseda]|uniref:Kinase-like domain-containing protein n=1 Tax=Podospora fimiseda TaxID=252190 RepID=A0AAN7BJL0_9PEZI|nr:kinase-like domain-containing protein [Podospora fimiseda]